MEKARGHLGLRVPSGRVGARTTSHALLLLNGKRGSGPYPPYFLNPTVLGMLGDLGVTSPGAGAGPKTEGASCGPG